MYSKVVKYLKIPLVLLYLFISFFVNAQSESKENTKKTESVFNADEILEYRIHYGWINGGKAYLKLKDTTYKGEEVFHAKGIGRTTGVADRLFNVHDIYESYFDKETLLPLKSIRDVKEGKYEKYNAVYYNHKNRYLRSQKSGLKYYPDTVPSRIYDLISAFYYARANVFDAIQKGELITIDTYFTDEFWPLQVRFRGYGTVKIKSGKYNCLIFSPVVEPGRVFESRDDVTIYISNDKNYIPISIKMDIIVGSFKTSLVSHSGLKYDLNKIEK